MSAHSAVRQRLSLCLGAVQQHPRPARVSGLGGCARYHRERLCMLIWVRYRRDGALSLHRQYVCAPWVTPGHDLTYNDCERLDLAKCIRDGASQSFGTPELAEPGPCARQIRRCTVISLSESGAMDGKLTHCKQIWVILASNDFFNRSDFRQGGGVAANDIEHSIVARGIRCQHKQLLDITSSLQQPEVTAHQVFGGVFGPTAAAV
jgi:hypothetical protein